MRRLCFYDIETSYIETTEKRWGLWDERPIERKIVSDFQVLSVAWSWDEESKIYVKAQCDFSSYKPGVLDDKPLMELMREELYNPAIGVVAHNGDQFDQKKARARIVVNDLPPASPYIEIDTKKMAKRIGGFTSNKLEDLARQLNVPHKSYSGGMATWDGVMAGDMKMWKRMKDYNKHDIPPLKGIYWKLRPHDKRNLPLNLILNNPRACPVCGVDGYLVKNGSYTSKTNSYQVWRCTNCKAYPRSRVPDYKQSFEKMEFVL